MGGTQMRRVGDESELMATNVPHGRSIR